MSIRPNLTPEENRILDEWLDSSTRPKLSTQTSLRLYELFLQGSSVREICELNKGVFPMGQILNARVADGWDARKAKHLDHLYGSIVERVSQTQAEGISFIADVMAMQHKLYGEKIKKFIQSGDEEDLKGLPTEYLTGSGYRKIIDALMKISGQDKQKDRLDERVPKPGSTRQPDEEMGITVPMKQLPAGASPAINTAAAVQLLKALDKMGIGD